MSPAPGGGSADPEVPPDGRRAKGQRRRRDIIDATLRIVEHSGVSGISHRSIAREAGVPPASIAYYFDGIDDLLVATLLDSVETMVGELESLRAEVDEGCSWAPTIARQLATMVRHQRGRTLAEYELYLLAARRPVLRPAARRWIEVLSGLIGGDTGDGGAGRDPGALAALIATIDGLLMQALIADEPPSAADFEPALEFLLNPGPPRRAEAPPAGAGGTRPGSPPQLPGGRPAVG